MFQDHLVKTDMSSINIIIIFLMFAVASLAVVSIINAQQTRRRLINHRLLQQKRKVEEMEEMAVAMEALTGSIAIERLVIEEIIDNLRAMQQLAPGNQSTELNLNNALQRLEELSNSAHPSKIYRLMQSDAQIARAQHHLNDAGRIVRRRHASGLIEISEMNNYISELAWAHLMVTVITLTAQGHLAISRGNLLRGVAFYKKAQQAAVESNLSDDRRHRFIKELGELTNNKRKAISVDLMPETDFNPPQVAAKPSTQPLQHDRSQVDNKPLSKAHAAGDKT